MERQLDELVRGIAENNKSQQRILDKIGILSSKAEGSKVERTIDRKFIVKIDVERCFWLLSENLTKSSVSTAYQVNVNDKLNHICMCFQGDSYLEIFINPIEKDVSEIHINGTNISIEYFQRHLQTINNILKK